MFKQLYNVHTTTDIYFKRNSTPKKLDSMKL